jgi:hypothetical protein
MSDEELYNIATIEDTCLPYSHPNDPNGIQNRNSIFFNLVDGQKIIVLPDVHGDLHYALTLLLLSEVIRIHHLDFDQLENGNFDDIEWIGGNTYVIQVGDQIDTERQIPSPFVRPIDYGHDIVVLNLFNYLTRRAQLQNGDVISLIGNHELANMFGSMLSVSNENINVVGSLEDRINLFSAERTVDETDQFGQHHIVQIPLGPIGKLIACTRLPFAIIGNNFFVHAGLTHQFNESFTLSGPPDRVEIRRGRLNNFARDIKMWLLGLLTNEEFVNFFHHYLLRNEDTNSLFFTRLLGEIPAGLNINDQRCIDAISNVLDLFGFNSTIIGHVIQSRMTTNTRGINATCSNRIIRIDQGNSFSFGPTEMQRRYIGTSHPQILKILNDTYTVVTSNIRYIIEDRRTLIIQLNDSILMNGNVNMLINEHIIPVGR